MSQSERETRELLEQLQWVQRLASGLVQDPSEADDLCQEALIASWNQGPKAKSTSVREGGLNAWFASVLRNKARSNYRSENRRRLREQAVARREPVDSQSSDVLERAELQKKLVDQVWRLREPFRTTILLRFFDGLDGARIARQQGIDLATVRSRVKRGLDMLRQSLDSEYGDRRSWNLACLAMLAARPAEIGTAASVTSTWSAITIGGIIMSAKTFSVAAVVTVSLLVGAFLLKDKFTQSTPSKSSNSITEVVELKDQAESMDDMDGEAALAELDTAKHESAMEFAVGDGQITGLVKDLNGQPLEGAWVYAYKSSMVDNAAEDIDLPFEIELPTITPDLSKLKNKSRTNKEGRFEISGLEADRYTLYTKAPKFQPTHTKNVIVKEDNSARVEVSLEPGFQIKGIVYDPEGKPYAGAVVSAMQGEHGFSSGAISMSINVSGDSSSSRTGGLSATSEADGSFVIDGLKDATYTLRAEKNKDWSSSARVRAEAGEMGVEVNMLRGAELSGVVFGPDGTPMADARVYTLSGPEFMMAQMPNIGQGGVLTDANGRFKLERVPAGKIRIRASKKSFPDSALVRVTAEDGEQVSDLEINLEAGASITGIVLDSQRQPLEDAKVTVSGGNSRLGANVFVMGGGMGGPSVITDAEGRFEVDGLKIGASYKLNVKHADYLTYKGENIRCEEASQDAGEIELEEGASVTGQVLDSKGNPIANASLRLNKASRHGAFMIGPMGGQVKATSGDDGRFELKPVAPGEYKIKVTAKGFAPYTEPSVQVEGREDVSGLQLTLSGGGSISGVVTDPDGQLVSDAQISLTYFGSGEQVFRQARTNSKGEFKLKGLADFEYDLSITKTGLTSFNEKVFPGPQPLDILLGAKGSLVGQVTDLATGAPLADFEIRLRKAGRRGMDGFEIDALGAMEYGFGSPSKKFSSEDGSFEMSSVNPGDYNVVVKSKGYIKGEFPVKILPDKESSVHAALDIGGAIQGRLVDHKGLAIANANVRVTSAARRAEDGVAEAVSSMIVSYGGEEGGMISTMAYGGGSGNSVRTDKDGFFTISGIEPGKVNLAIRHKDYIKKVVKDIEVAKGVTRELEPTKLQLGCKLFGIAYDEKGDVVTQGMVSIMAVEGGGMPQFIAVKSDGSYSKSGLAPATYELGLNIFDMEGGGISIGGDDEFSIEVTIDEGEKEKELDIRKE